MATEAPSSVRLLSDLEILDRPNDQSIQALHDYWIEKKGAGSMLLRGSIDPLEIKSHLPLLFMLDVLEGGQDFSYRLIGTTTATMSGRDVTGATFGSLYAVRPGVMATLRSLFRPVIVERRPVFASGRVFWRPERDFRRFEGGYFPISGNGTEIDIILGEVQFS